MTSLPEPPGVNRCALCGEPMPDDEQMFNYHGYSGPCPKPPKAPPEPPGLDALRQELIERVHEIILRTHSCGDPTCRHRMEAARKILSELQEHGGGSADDATDARLKQQDAALREAQAEIATLKEEERRETELRRLVERQLSTYETALWSIQHPRPYGLGGDLLALLFELMAIAEAALNAPPTEAKSMLSADEIEVLRLCVTCALGDAPALSETERLVTRVWTSDALRKLGVSSPEPIDKAAFREFQAGGLDDIRESIERRGPRQRPIPENDV